MPVVGPGMLLGSVTMVPAHYTAATTVPTDTASYLRSIQRDYTLNRGYSIGYNFAVDQTGQAWECRGFDIKCAANKGANDTTIAVLCLVDGAEAMNTSMCLTFSALGAEAERRCGDSLLVVGHRDIGATACPGDGIYGQVCAGVLEPGTEPEPIPPSSGGDIVQCVFTSQTNPREFNATFIGTGDEHGRTIELQWSGNGDDPAVQARIATCLEAFGPARELTLAGVRNNRLHPKHRPSDITDSLHVWTDSDFAP
jgi:hypothetical protein